MATMPSKIGKYEIVSMLGKGGMGVVYKGIDPDIPAEVAIKSILPEHLEGANRAELLQRFRREVIACRRLKHTNIVATYAYYESGNSCYIVMEYVEGSSLSDYLKGSHSVEIEKSLHIMEQLLSALDCAHNQGVIHRDIKPSNILIKDDDVIQVADFGIAKLDTSDLTLTGGSIIGSPGYMSPEQCSGKRVDNRADLFSAGVLLYQLLTGKKPFTGENVVNTLQNILTVDPVNPSEVNESLPPSLDAVVKKAIEKNPDQRFQSAVEFSTALKKAFHKESKINFKRSVLGSSMRFSLPILVLGLGALVFVYFRMDFETPPESDETIVDSGPPLPIEPIDDPSLDRLNSMLDGFECSSLQAEQYPEGNILVSGALQASDFAKLKSWLEEATGESGFETALREVDPAFCQEVTMLTPYVVLNEAKKYGLDIEPYQHTNQYLEGETIQLQIETPEQDMYFYVDYFQSDATVIHLYPLSDEENTLQQGNNGILLGADEKQWEVSPPFGKDLLSVIASPKRLIDSARDEVEGSKEYFAILQASMNNAQETSVIADYFYIETAANSN